MSVAAISWTFRQKVPPTAKLVLLALSDHADDRGRCWPGIDAVAEKTGLNPRTVQRQIRLLEKTGVVRIELRFNESGRQTSSVYELEIGVWRSATPPRHADGVAAADCHPRGRQAATPEGGTVPPESIRGTIRGTVDLSSPDGEDVRGEATDHRASERKAKNKTPPCPHEQIIELYHELLPMCPKVREWNKTREGLLRARWRDDPKRHDLNWWRDFFRYIAQSDFLTGQTQGRSDRPPFVADLEWLLRPSNFAKVIEGRYENRRPHEH
jgi:hypothetical protein